MEPASPVGKVLADVRVLDPASRDQDADAWRRGRFAERVRREWNPVRSPAIEAARTADGYDLGALAESIRKVVGGNAERIVGRLWTFWEMEHEGRPPAGDPLLRPGAPA